MRIIIFSGLFALALLAAVLGAIGGQGSTWVAAHDSRDMAHATSALSR